MANSFDDLKDSYGPLFNSMSIRSSHRREVDAIVNKIVSLENVYRAIMDATGVPWQIVGTIHSLEADLRMRHLHNGDPLTARTVQVPAGRPKHVEPPFTFAESAIDALTMHNLNEVKEWTLERTLYELERYNGFGNRGKGIHTPYLWSFSNQYEKGKFIRDHVFDTEAVSQQCGGAVILKRMIERNLFVFGSTVVPVKILVAGATLEGVFFQNSVWTPARATDAVLGEIQIDAVRMSPFKISISHGDKSRAFDATLFFGNGFIRARELFNEFLGHEIVYDDNLKTLTVG